MFWGYTSTTLMVDMEPTNYHETLMNKTWKKMKEESIKVEVYDTWELIELPSEKKAIKS